MHVRKPSVIDRFQQAVWDPDGSTIPLITAAADTVESGRGLAMVHALCGGHLGWFRSETTGGKVVWARYGP